MACVSREMACVSSISPRSQPSRSFSYVCCHVDVSGHRARGCSVCELQSYAHATHLPAHAHAHTFVGTRACVDTRASFSCSSQGSWRAMCVQQTMTDQEVVWCCVLIERWERRNAGGSEPRLLPAPIHAGSFTRHDKEGGSWFVGLWAGKGGVPDGEGMTGLPLPRPGCRNGSFGSRTLRNCSRTETTRTWAS